MGDMQAIVDGVSLDNGDWRIITGSYGLAQSVDGSKVFVVQFLLQGDSAEELQERYQATIADFGIKNNVPFSLTLDGAATGAGEFLESIEPFTDGIGKTMARVSSDDASPQTDKSMALRLELFAETPGLADDAEGLVDDPKLGIAFTASRTMTRSLLVTFAASNGNTAEQNYLAKRDDYLEDWLLTGQGGQRSDSTGMALVSEEFEQNEPEDPETLTVLLVAEYMDKKMTGTQAAAASFSMSISKRFPEEWSAGGGTTPILYDVVAVVPIRRDVITNVELFKTYQATLEKDLNDAFRKATGEGTFSRLTSPVVTPDLKTNSVTLRATYQTRNNRVISYDVLTSRPDRAKYRVADKADGFQHLQVSPAPSKHFVEMTVTRIGVGESVLDPPPPSEPGFTFIYESSTPGKSERLNMPFSPNMYRQTLLVRWERVKLGTSTGSQAGRTRVR